MNPSTTFWIHRVSPISQW